MIKTAVITGCLGFIGIAVTRLFLASGWNVYGLDKITYAANPRFIGEFAGPRFQFHKLDICDLQELPDCDVVINIAASSHVERSIRSADMFIHDNVFGVYNLLEMVRKKHSNCTNVPLFFHFSTDEVYGPADYGVSWKEDDRLNPLNPYSASKASADMFITSYSNTHGIVYNIIRPTNNYGKFQYPEKLIPLSVRNLLRGQKIRLHDGGEPIRTFLHVDDTAEAVLRIVEHGKPCELYNCSGGFEQSNKTTVRKIIESFYESEFKDKHDYELIEQHVDYKYHRDGQDLRYAVDDSKLRALGWNPSRGFNETIFDIVQHYKTTFAEDYRW